MPIFGLKNSVSGLSVSSTSVSRTSDYWIAFDGINDYVSISSSLNSYFGAKDWSVSAWIYHSGASGTIFSTGHIGSGNAFRFDITSDKLKFYFGQSSGTNVSATASSGLTDDTWYQVGITHDDSEETVKFYVNGSVTDTFTKNIPGVVHDTNARIGALAESGSSNELTGRIANVAVFNDLVTAGEMTNLASAHSYDATSIGGCVGWWRMGAGTEAGEGSTIYDMSSNSNNGTLTGGTIESGTIE